MAISRRSFLGDRDSGTPGTVRAGGMRRISPKDTSNLLKSVNAINKNLVSINKLLQQQSRDRVTAQRTQQEDKIRQAENLKKQATEKDLENAGGKGVGDALKKTLAEPAKKITKGLMSFVKPFLLFFTVTFVGWFSKGVVAWFKKEKEVKKKQIKEALPKIMSFLTIAGGVLLALNGGIPVIIGLIGTMVKVATTAIAALLNPLAFKAILAAAAVGLGVEVYSFAKDSLVPGSKAKDRIRATLESGDEREKFTKFIEGLPTDGQSISGNKNLVKFGEQYFAKEGLLELAAFEKGGVFKLGTFDATGQKVGEQEITAELLKQGKVLQGIDVDNKEQLVSILETNRLAQRFGKLYEKKAALSSAKAEYARVRSPGGGSARGEGYSHALQSSEAKKKEAMEAVTTATQEYERAKAQLRKTYSSSDDALKKLLERDYNITSVDSLESKLLEGSELAHQFRRAGRFVTDQANQLVEPVKQGFEAVNSKIEGFTDALAETISEFDINISVNPAIENTDDGKPNELPVDGVGIAPFDSSNPFISYAKKTYTLLGVA